MSLSLASETPLPWHEGELCLQRSVDAAERMEAVGRRAIRNHLIDQHRLFYPLLPFVVLGAIDANGAPWATLRANDPGFLTSPDPLHLKVILGRDPDDPAESGMDDGAAVGLLGIELHTGRRNRLNGTISRNTPAEFSIAVEESFGNCARYIHQRNLQFSCAPRRPWSGGSSVVLPKLDDAAVELIRRADTFFVASYATDANGHRRVDVSHRGGPAGFVRLDDDGALTIPDFNGNRFFNTLGNFLVNPWAGLAFVDFENGNMLQMTGDAEVILGPAEVVAMEGAERLWRFYPRHIINRVGVWPLRQVAAPKARGASHFAAMSIF